MAEENNENKTAREAQEKEMEKLGITPASKREKNEGEESDDELESEDVEEEDTEEEDEEESDEEDSEEEEDDSEDEEDNEDDEEEETEEEDQSHKKKGISFKQFNKLRSDLRTANAEIAKLKEGEKEEVPEDFSQRIEEISKEIGVENPEGLKKIMAFVQEVVENNSKKSKAEMEKKLTELEDKYGKIAENAPIQDEFGKEWKTFNKGTFAKDFPNATDEELEAAQELMNKMSHTPNVGGKVYEQDGKKLLDPYPLDYIYFKNKDKFAELVTGKKSRGLESGRTQGISKDKGSKEENKPLRKGASVKEIQEYEKRSGRAMEGLDSLSEPVDDTI